MELPKFYDSSQVGTLFQRGVGDVVDEARLLDLTPSSQDKKRVSLILVDFQIDFCHPTGTLYVPGAEDDLRRTCEFIYRNVDKITRIHASLDSHLAYQIFYPTWWVDERGEHPDPFTMITSDDLKNGRWKSLILPAESLAYVKELEDKAQKNLMIWPYHTMIGSVGHALDPALFEAVQYHAAARKTQPEFMTKGTIPQTENYSILEPEVKVSSHPQGNLNTSFLDMVAQDDVIYVAGEAKSHCVLATVTSMMRYFKDRPEVIKKIRFLKDCTSSVQHPDIDFDAIADAELSKFEQDGLVLEESTVAIV